jgi:UDP-N-acetylmuramate--alanine ligase
MSEIFYAGGTAVKDISANDLINDLKALGKSAFFVANRKDFLATVRRHLTDDCVLLLMAARDPSLEQFARQTWQDL